MREKTNPKRSYSNLKQETGEDESDLVEEEPSPRMGRGEDSIPATEKK